MARAVGPGAALSELRALVAGAGAVGGRACRQLVQDASVSEVVLADRRHERAEQLARQMGEKVRPLPLERLETEALDLAVLTVPVGQRDLAERCLSAGAHVVSTVSSEVVVRQLLELDAVAKSRSRSLAVGAAFAPGLSCVLASHGSTGLERVDEIEVAKTGVAGPACEAERWRAARPGARDFGGLRGAGARHRSGPVLVWFPAPLGCVECRPGSFPDELLLSRAFPDATHLVARSGDRAGLAGAFHRPLRQRRERVEALGAVRVELCGRVGGAVEMRVLGAVDRPSVAAGAVAAQAGLWAAAGRLEAAGAAGLAELVADTVGFLGELAERGVKAAALGRAVSASR